MACKLDVDLVVKQVIEREIKNISFIENNFANTTIKFNKKDIELIVKLNKQWGEKVITYNSPIYNDVPGNITIFISEKLYDKYIKAIDKKRNVENTEKIREELRKDAERAGVEYTDDYLFQKQTQSQEGIIASEKTIRDLAARIADRIGMKVVFESDRSKEYKGKIENNVAYINLAYATLDTPIHEILGHPIIRAIKNKTLSSYINKKYITEEEFFEKIKGKDSFTDYEWRVGDNVYQVENYNDDNITNHKYTVSQLQKNELYENLLKELEYGKGKEVLDRIKRDYNKKFERGKSFTFEGKDYIADTASKTGYRDKYGDDVNSNELETALFAYELKHKDKIYYTLEEQQEEAIVELLGLMTAEKLDKVKDGKLISLLKRLLKEIKAFMKDILFQKEVEIENLPDNMTLGDIADLLAYSNSKLILPGYEVEYTTPDNNKFKTYQEASNHISDLAKSVKDVDLDKNISVDNIDKEIEILQKELDNFKFEIEPFNKFTDVYTKKGRLRQNYWARKKDGTTGWTGGSKETLIEPEYDGFVLDTDRGDGRFITKISDKEAEELYYAEENKFNTTTKASREKYAELETKIHNLKNNSLKGFIEKNKEYEQSKEIIEEWKKINDIQYNPEEIYSRGQEFVSIVGAYSDFDVNLMMQNLLSHIEDNEKAGGKFAISAFTKPVDKQIGHLEGGGGKIKFKLYPKSKDILWAANTDVYSGSVWDASEKVNKDKKSELLGVSYTKYPSLRNVDAVQPNLAAIVDNLSHHHNELAISLNFSNFELEVDEDVPYTTKKIIENINKILQQKRNGKLVKPEINKINTIPDTFEYWQQDMNEDGGVDRFRIQVYKKNNKWFEEFFDTYGQSESVREITYNEMESQFNEALASNSTLTRNKGIQPKITKDNLKESIESVKNKTIKDYTNFKTLSGNTLVFKDDGFENNKIGDTVTYKNAEYKIIGEEKENSDFPSQWILQVIEKEYTEQALINTKIAKLKEVAKKYPRSLIRSEVKRINTSSSQELYDQFGADELPFQKISKDTQELFDKIMNTPSRVIDEKIKNCL